MDRHSQHAPGESADSLKITGLLLTGEALDSLTPERLASVRRLIGRHGLDVEVLYGTPEKREVSNLSATREDFIAFGREHSEEYNRATKLAGLAWAAIYTAYRRETQYRYASDLPPITFAPGKGTYSPYYAHLDTRAVELRSLHKRLVESKGHPFQRKVQTRVVAFLTHLLNEKLELDPPLSFDE